jgi:hypothetical protein
MASVVIIHAAEDALPARALAEKLRAAKLTPVMEKYGSEVRDAARGAKVAIALWSPRSVGSESLVADVEAVRAKSKIVHARMQNAPPPNQFNADASFDLTGWRGEDDFRPWRELAADVTTKAGVAPLPPPAPRGTATFFQPGRATTDGAPAPAGGQRPAQNQQRQQAPRAAAQQPQRQAAQPSRQQPPQRSAPAAEEKKSGSPMAMILIGVLLLAGIGGGGYWYMTQNQGASNAASAWEEVAKNDAGAIRAFLAASPGEFQDDAEQALSELEQQTFDAAQEADTIEAFEAFLAEFPESDNAIAARGRIAELRAQPPAPVEGEETPLTMEVPVDPDLVPPTTATPETGGPATLTPPPPAPDPAAPAPTTP